MDQLPITIHSQKILVSFLQINPLPAIGKSQRDPEIIPTGLTWTGRYSKRVQTAEVIQKSNHGFLPGIAVHFQIRKPDNRYLSYQLAACDGFLGHTAPAAGTEQQRENAE